MFIEPFSCFICTMKGLHHLDVINHLHWEPWQIVCNKIYVCYTHIKAVSSFSNSPIKLQKNILHTFTKPLGLHNILLASSFLSAQSLPFGQKSLKCDLPDKLTKYLLSIVKWKYFLFQVRHNIWYCDISNSNIVGWYETMDAV